MKKYLYHVLVLLSTCVLGIFCHQSAWAQNYNAQNIATGGLYTALTKDVDGNIYVIRAVSPNDANYQLVKYTNGQGQPTVLYSGLTHDAGNYPWGLAVAANGQIFVSTHIGDNGNKILKLTNSNGIYTVSDFQNNPSKYYTGLAIDANDRLHVLQHNGTSYEVVRYHNLNNNSGYTSLFSGIPSEAGLSYATNLAIATNGDIYYTEPFCVDEWYAHLISMKGGVVKVANNGGNYNYTSKTYLSKDKYASALSIEGNDLYALESTGAAGGYKLSKYSNLSGTGAALRTDLKANAFIYPWGVVFKGDIGYYTTGDDGNSGGSVMRIVPNPNAGSEPPNEIIGPESKDICANVPTSFSLTTTGATAHQWEVSTDGGNTFNNVQNNTNYNGVTSATLSIVNTPASFNTYIYRCKVTFGAAGSKYSSIANLLVTDQVQISTQPLNTQITIGGSGSLSVTASDATSYQWQRKIGGGVFSNISDGGSFFGTNSATLQITNATAALNSDQFRCIVTNNCLSAKVSNVVTLTVNAAPSISQQPGDKTIMAGGQTAFTMLAIGATGYQWQVSTGGAFSDVANGALYSGVTSNTLTITGVTMGMNGYLYRCVVSGAIPPEATSLPARLAVTVPPNQAPVIVNLHGDLVAWAGVGNTVTLDESGNAGVSDADMDALNAGLGDYNGASLTVQRAGNTVSADDFGFITTGASFTVVGNHLQTGGSTFASFTNAGGVLTISFTSSGTAATRTLVNEVIQRITYRNDTPAGDATMRFTLSDGIASTTADVTVASDTIYVTNTTDTPTINVANGVSFSEAIAIAAADATGSQTLIFTNSFNSSVSLAGNLSINESLTLNADAAGGLVISSGATITLGGGTTLSFTNSSGTVDIAATLSGTGSLTKDGAGTLTLSSVNNKTNMSGGITVNAGTLVVSDDDHLSSGTLTLNGGTLTNSSTSFTIDNTIALGSSGGTFNVGGGNGSTRLTLSGIVSGTGTLTKNGQAILQLDGNNTYSGATSLMAGTMIATHSNALGTTAGATTVSSGATLRFAGGLTVAEALTISGAGKTVSSVDYGVLHLINGSSTLSGNVTLVGDANISVAGGTLIVSGALIGSGNLNKTDVGSLLLSNTGTEASMSGGMTVSAGALEIDNDDQLSSGSLSLNGGTLAVIGVTTIDNNIDITASSTINTSADVTLSGVVSGTGELTKAGVSTLSLSGTNTATGAVNISEGGLTISGGSSIGNTSAVTVASLATLTLSGGDETIGSLAGAGNVVLGYKLIIGGNNSSTTFNGVISGIGNGIAKIGTGTFTLSGSNTYSGSTTVSAGTLALYGGTAINDASAVTVSSGATLSLNANETLGSLAGAGNVSLGDFALSSGGNNASTTFSGVFNGYGGFLKTGSGTLTLSGSNSGTFFGGMAVSGGGTLSVANDDNLGSGILSINNSTFSITGATTIDNSITLISGASINNAAAVTLSGVISGSGSFTKTGIGVLTLPGINTYGGATQVLAGTLAVNGALSATNIVEIASGATLIGSGSVTNLNVNNGGTLSPGNSAGTFTVDGNLLMNSGSTLAIEINGTTAGTDYDQVVVLGNVNVSGANLSVTHGYTPGQGDNYSIIVNDAVDVISGTFSGLAEGSTITAGGNGSVLTASYIGGSGNDFTLTAPINAAPVIGNLNGDAVTYIEGGTVVVIDAGADATVTDTDSPDFDGGNVAVSIAANRVPTEDVLSIRNQGTAAGQIGVSGLNITYGGTIIGTRTASGGTDTYDLVITLNASATPAIVQALLRNLTYTNTNTTDPSTSARTVGVTINDGDGGTSTPANVTLDVVAVNDAPTLTATALNPTFTEGGEAVAMFSNAQSSTIEAGQLIQQTTLTVSGVQDPNTEELYIEGTRIVLSNGMNSTTAVNAINVNVSVAGTTATVTLSKLSGVSTSVWNTLVNGITYLNTSKNPTTAARVVALTSIQDDGGIANGGVDRTTLSIASTVTIVAVNNAPIVTTSGGNTAYTEGTPVAVDAALTVTDPDNTTLATATVAITGNLQSTQDVLTFTNDGATMGNITAALYNNATGVLTLSSVGSSATLAQWQAALRAVKYNNTSQNPSTAARTMSFKVHDGGLESVAATKTVSVIAVNDAPVAVDDYITLTEDIPVVGNVLTNDSDPESNALTASLVTPPVNGTVVLNADGSFTYTPNANYAGRDSLQYQVCDDGVPSKCETAWLHLTINPVNDAPVVTVPANISVTEDVASPLTGISFSDVDAGANSVLVTLSVPSGALNAASTMDVTVGGTAETLTLSGSISKINAFIAAGAVTFTTASHATTNVILTVSITDNGHTGGTALMDTKTTTLVVTAVNDAPVNSVPGAQSVDQDATLVFSASNSNLISISDVDAGGGVVKGTLTATNGLLTLSGTNGLSFIFGGNGNATMTFEGAIADINAALDGLVFTPTPGYNGPASIQILTNDLGLTGTGGAQIDIDNIIITVNSINPRVISVGALTANGTYKIDDAIALTVTFDQAVTVDGGVPTLVLETGTTDQSATYVAGSGSNTLTFNYTVQAGDQSSDLDYISTAALSLNGATIKNTFADDAILTLPAVGGSNSIAGQRSIVIDGVVPTVTSMSVPADGYYVRAQNLDFIVNFSEAVTLDVTGGSPRIALSIADQTTYAGYLSGSGTTTLVFRYTVANGLQDDDGITVGSLSLNGGTLWDAAGNNADLTLNSVGNTSAVKVDSKISQVVLSINDGETHTNNAQVNLNLQIDDTDLSTMKFSNDNVSWSAEESFFNTKLWDLTPGDATKTIYVSVKDLRGNITETSGSIILDQKAPIVTGVEHGKSYNDDRTISFDEGTGTLNTTSFISGEIVDAEGTYELIVVDVAGNRTIVNFVIDKTAPAQPTNLVSTAGDTEVNLTWDANGEVDLQGYILYSQAQGSSRIKLADIPKGTVSFLHTGLTNGILHQYFLVAADTLGNTSTEALTSATPMGTQNITFTPLADRTYGDLDFLLSASASSGLQVSYTTSDATVAEAYKDAADGNKWKLRITGAGTVDVIASQGGSAAYLPAVDVTQTLKVGKANLMGISFTNATFGYDGTAKSLATTGTLPAGVTVNYSGNAQTEAGIYPVTATIDGGNNYIGETLTAELTITKAALVGINFANATFGYDGRAKSLAITGALPIGVTVSYSGNAQTEAGTYPVTATIDGGNNYIGETLTADLTISKAALVGINFTNATFGYDGTSKSLAITGALPAGVTVNYSGNGKTEAGTYPVTATIDGGNNYIGETLTADLTISKAALMGINFTNATFGYDGTAKSLAITGALPTGVTVNYSGNGKTEAGTYPVTATIDGGNNYLGETLTADLTITKAALVGINFANATFVYDGTSKSLAITGALPTGVTVNYSGNGKTEAGTYPVTATIDGGNNYVGETLTADLTITKAALVDIGLANATFVYDGTSKSLAITGALPTGVTVNYSGNGKTEAGVHPVTATIDGGNNYVGQTLNASLTITKAALVGIGFANATFVYDGTAKSLAITGTLPTGATVSYSGNAKTVAGVHSVTATIDGGNNYVGQTLNASLTITKAQQVISFAAIEPVYRDAGELQLDISSNSELPIKIYSDNVLVAEVTGDRTVTVKGVGLTRIRAEQDGNANYMAAEKVVRELRVRNEDGARLPVRVNQAVSPNGDGINDYLRIEGIDEYPENKIAIFDANGNLVREIKNYNNSSNYFDGVREGRAVPTGTYFYVLEVRMGGKWHYDKGFFVVKY
ncbi:autotransporter-associated beta strand repeat-containing protein [Sphingobacterium sp. SYP-B4668]|uniref:autotransporter-associated beta strand repeat-containing protein n=1 Tax=Sphingobacterium sp. SYP-B4668 TaxID=2996035 RepID=UPI0022DE03B1|nr:Ig-like domain-containing protein [Sphingobacterium sp. SYP-B4668]